MIGLTDAGLSNGPSIQSARCAAAVLVPAGYAAWAVGKWHLTPEDETHLGATRARWPLGRGFERFYGFMTGDTSQWFPDLLQDNTPVPPPATPAEGYHLNHDLADRAIQFIKDENEDICRTLLLVRSYAASRRRSCTSEAHTCAVQEDSAPGSHHRQ